MKSILVLLFSLSFLTSIAQSRSYDHSISAMESSASFQACNSINDSLFIVDLFADSMEFEFPAFGFNSDIGYDNLDDTLLIKDSLVKYLNFGNADFVEVITALAPDMLRFPGGTQSNSYNLYGSEYIMNGGNIDSIRYYLENPYAEEVDILEYNSNRNYYFFKEASFLKNSPFMQEEVFEGELNGSLNLLKETATFRNVNGGSTYDYYVVNNKYNNNEFNFLRDFIALTDSAEFLPVYVVRMFDPLLFVHVEDTFGNEQVSPLLLKISGYPLSSD
ncbi:MAG: hypothetical protein HKN45_02950, partial [Flavobacteriales bacterium]|nr:hypothetical protein [Flavobacteriales bacterium]